MVTITHFRDPIEDEKRRLYDSDSQLKQQFQIASRRLRSQP